MGTLFDKVGSWCGGNENDVYGQGVGGGGGGGTGGGPGAGSRGGAGQAKSKLKKPAKKIDRSMIGAPENFQHTGHIGASDMSTGTGLTNIQTQMQGKGGHTDAEQTFEGSVVTKAIDLDTAFKVDREEREGTPSQQKRAMPENTTETDSAPAAATEAADAAVTEGAVAATDEAAAPVEDNVESGSKLHRTHSEGPPAMEEEGEAGF